MGSHVIVGAGIAGIYAAFLIKKNNPQHDVYLVDKAKNIGGLLRSHKYDHHGYFDIGIHTINESGVPEVDQFLLNALEESEWHHLSGVKRDFGGTVFKGHVQNNSTYLDLRSLPADLYQKCVDSFFKEHKPLASHYTHLESLFLDKFGSVITREVLAPAVFKVYGKPLNELTAHVAKLLPFERIVLFDENKMSDLMSSEDMRSRLAFTDQSKLPEHLISKKKSYYPKVYGLQGLIDRLEAYLVQLGIKVIKEASVSDVEVQKQKISKIVIQQSSGHQLELENIKQVYCTAGLFVTAQMFKLPVDYSRLDKPLKTYVVHLVLNKKPEVKDVYYMYCFEKNYITHRLACPSSFCKDSYSNGLYKMTVEVILKDSSLTKDQIKNQVIDELRALKILTDHQVSFSAIEDVEGGYAMPTINMQKNIDELRDKIISLKLENFNQLGVMSEPNLFFQTDVLTNVYKNLKNEA